MGNQSLLMEKIIGPAGSECYRISHKSGAEVTIARHGGHLISWKTADGCERFYLSPTADFSTGKAIRGGVPVIFPQFNHYGPFSRHGFARNINWLPDPDNGAMQLKSTPETLAEWPHPFEISIRPVLAASTLEIEFTVTNPGPESFPFQAALHTYFRIQDIENTTISGLQGQTFHDELTGKTTIAGDFPITLGSETDRAYFGGAVGSIQLHDQQTIVTVESDSFVDAVIWNPGPDHGIGDLPEDGWQQFVCIESARIRPEVTLDPGNSWRGVQRLSCSYLAP